MKHSRYSCADSGWPEEAEKRAEDGGLEESENFRARNQDGLKPRPLASRCCISKYISRSELTTPIYDGCYQEPRCREREMRLAEESGRIRRCQIDMRLWVMG